MSQVITARLARNDAQPWGFRLQGGKDFGTPLVIQKVNTGSIADNAGLKAGDAVVRLNQTDLYNLRHKDAQDAIVRAGPQFELVIQRGGATWKPSVTPVASPIPGNYTPVTKTSLAANKQQVSNFGSGHNSAAKPFIPASPVRSIGNKQYNTPVAMYSDEVIAETLSSQAEVLAGGVLGVNFKKNEKVYNPEKSEVLKALQENDSEPEPAGSTFYWRQSHAIGGSATSHDCQRPLTPSYQGPFNKRPASIHDDRMGTSLQQNTLSPGASHRPSLPVHPQPVQKPAPHAMPSTIPEEKNIGANTISSALNAHAGNLNGNAPSNFSAPKPFSYTQAAPAGPPMAAPKSPSSYPPPAQPSWAPSSAAAPAAPKPVAPAQEPEASYKAETFSNVFSSRKETWQKLTSSSVITKVEQKCEEFNLKEPVDDNPDNSIADMNEAEQVDPEDDVEAEIRGMQAGPNDGTYYQLPPSNIPQPTPKAYLTDFHKALLTTPDRPFQMGDIAPTPEPMMHQPDLYEEAVKEAEKYPLPEEPPKKPKRVVPKFEVKTNKHDIEFPYTDEDVRRGSLLCSMMRTVSPIPMKFVKSNIIEEVNLPDDSEAYFPPDISMQPNEPYPDLDSYRNKSPFVGALTTVPDRPYTPFGREIMSQLSMELPPDTRKITFSNALHTAPDDSFDPSSMECEYDPIEYTAKSYEMVAEELNAEDEETASNSSAFARVSSSPMRSFLPTIQPWSVPSENIPENTYTNSMCCQESAECQVSESRRGSQYQASGDRRRSSVQTQCPCDSERCNKNSKPISELLKTKVREEDEFDPDMPNPKAPYPRRAQAPSPFEGMQVKVTNKMTSSLHKADEIPNYQRKWYNLPTQNPPKTPEPEELRENVPMAFKEWPSRQSSVSRAESVPRHENARETIAEIAESAKSSKPPVPSDYAYFASSRKTTATEAVTRYIESDEAADEVCEMAFPTSTPSFPCSTGSFPTSTRRCLASPECHDSENSDDVFDMKFPTMKTPPPQGGFPTRGVRKNSLADLPARQKVQFEKQRSLHHELHSQQQKMQQKNKLRQKIELEAMQSGSSRVSEESTQSTSAKASEEAIGQKIQKNQRLSAYEQEQEYKRQIELERMQRQKEQELKEQQAREADYNRRMEISRQHEIKLREKREIDLQQETQREMEYQKIRSEQEEIEQRQREERDLELRREQENIEMELRKQQEREKRMAEAREAQRLFEIRRKQERDQELEKIERELREKREDELRRLEKEVRDRREQKQREELEAEKLRCQQQREREMAEREQKRLEEEAAKIQQEREHKVQLELKWRQKQESDRKQREEMELFNIEEEKRRNAKAYTSSTYQQSAVWPPTSKPPTPALVQQPRQVPIIKTDSETELNSTRFRFEPLDEDQRRFMAGIRPPSTCYSPATEDKPYPSIPYYQQHLAFYEAEADHCGVFNPKALSPTPNRSKSPAFGPPPNPLLAFVNKARDPELDESGIYLCGERLLSPIWYDKHKKQIPAPVQRKIHPLGGSSRPPSKPDIAALSAAVRKHRMENAGTRPPPTPPPMPGQKSSPKSGGDDVSATEPCNTPAAIPKGSVGQPGAVPKHGRTFTTTGPTRGQGVLTQPSTGRIPVCGGCACQVRGPFITALGKTWCPAHFLCVNPSCKRELVDIGFVEEKGDLYCEYCFEQFLAPPCSKCNGKIKGDCLNAIGKKFHPECFKCTYCGKLFGNSPFFLEEGDAYCEADWNELFTTKCFACGFPVEAGDRWVEALNNNYHSQCFNCTYCKKNLEGQSFFSKGGRPFCKNHAR